MNKFTNIITKIKPTKKVILITAGSLVLLALLVVGMVVQVRAERADRAVQAARLAEVNDLKTENATLKKQVTEAQAASQFQTAKSDSVCSWVKSQAPRYRFVVPPLCKS